MRRFTSYGPALVVLITAVLTLVLTPEIVRRVGHATTDVWVQIARTALDQDNILEQLNAATRAIAEAVEPSTVHIALRTPVAGRRAMVRLGQGSGWVYDERGHIVTNSHVVSGATGRGEIIVQFYDGRSIDAEIVGIDTLSDIAVLRVETTQGLVPVRRASGQSLSQGERVYAFGSPFGFKFSMSEGIVSGLGRDPRGLIGGGEGYTNFIQTDAAVNPGNSGGPLVDIYGRLVGMNVAIATASTPAGAGTSGQNSGISFAIPLDTIESVVNSIVGGGVVRRGYMGVSLPQSDEANRLALAEAGYDRSGVVVGGVPKDGPAYRGGIQEGDVILAIDNIATPTPGVLRQRITINQPGEPVDVQIWRKGEVLTKTITLGDLASTEVAWRRVYETLIGAFGVLVEPIADGVAVARVEEGGQGFVLGLRPYQAILAVNGTQVSNIQDFLRTLSEGGFLNGVRAELLILERSGVQRTLTIQYRP